MSDTLRYLVALLHDWSEYRTWIEIQRGRRTQCSINLDQHFNSEYIGFIHNAEGHSMYIRVAKSRPWILFKEILWRY
jgi:hypothetical protein